MLSFATRRLQFRRLYSTSVAQTLSCIKNSNLVKTTPYIFGEFQESSKTNSFPVTNPYDDSILIDVTSTSIPLLQTAFESATDSFYEFSHTTPRSRSVILNNLSSLILDNVDDLAKLITLENGKPLADALGEVKYAASFFQWFAEEAPRIYGDIIPSSNPHNRILTIRQAVGPVGILTPWNFPLAMITRKLGAAIASGCTTVIKPAAETPLSALALAQLCKEAGVPDGVANIVPVDNKNTPEIGKIFCETSLLKKVSFTGSTRVGKILMSQSSNTLKKLSFELGGNAPFIVFNDVKSIDDAVEGLISSKFRSSGQTCVCTNRVFIQSGIYDKFQDILIEKLSKRVKLGPGMDPTVNYGPLIHSRAVEKVQFQIKDAVSKGAEIVFGGQRRSDLGPTFHELTVLRNVNKQMDIYQTETFGPIAPLIRFDDIEDVIEMANDTKVGLAGYVYSGDYEKLIRIGEELHVGMVGANTGLISENCLPFGGVLESGFGREGSKYGVEEYTVLKSIVLKVK